MHYRPEIDGLRALAVLPVILFHAGFSGFSGGFLGVDIFFFISGYLITHILSEEMESGRFSIALFYERRARRILPALFLVLFASFPFAIAWLLPAELRDFGASALSTLAFGSNIFFCWQTGYFSPNTELMPLLHTWSLSVEEQFYLLFPMLLAVLLKAGRRATVVALTLLAIASLLYAFSSFSDEEAIFFSAPARAWELLAGAISAFGTRQSTPLRSDILSSLGLLAVLWAIFMHRPSDWPSDPYALLAVVGTALVVLFGTKGTFVAMMLSLRPLVGVGLISYSAYLWHQPIFAFTRVRIVSDPPAILMAGLTVLTIGLAFLTWKYVEVPFRHKGAGAESRRRLLVLGLATCAFLASACYAVRQSDGLSFRFSPTQRQWIAASDFRTSMRIYGLGSCFIDQDQTVDVLVKNRCDGNPARRRVIIFGDSEAAHLVAGARRAIVGKDIELAQWTATGCKPYAYTGNSRRCINMINAFYRTVLPTLTKDDIVLVGANWSTSYEELGTTAFSRAVKSSLMRIARQGTSAVIIGDVPNFSFNPLRYLIQRDGTHERNILVRAEHGSSGSTANELVRKAASAAGFSFMDPASIFCAPNEPSLCLILKEHQPLFLDGNHLLPAGSELLMGTVRLYTSR